MPTTCKTWSCGYCRSKMLALFRARIETGVLALGRCAFITVTYKQGRFTRPGAPSAKAEWARLLLLLKTRLPPIQWLKVTELTEKKTPHYHIVVGPIHGRVRCYGTDFKILKFRRRLSSCDCLSHVVSRAWLEVTGDSYICHATPVLGAAGAASYMAKYLGKTLTHRTELVAMGFVRRWSTSRGWPGNGRMRLAQSKPHGAGWERHDFIPGGIGKLMMEENPEWLEERIGPDLVKQLELKRNKKRVQGLAERMLGNA